MGNSHFGSIFKKVPRSKNVLEYLRHRISPQDCIFKEISTRSIFTKKLNTFQKKTWRRSDGEKKTFFSPTVNSGQEIFKAMIRQHAQPGGGGKMHFAPRVDDLVVTFLILGVGCPNFAGIYFRWRSLHFLSLFSHTPTDRPHNMGWATIADRFWKILSKFV